MMHPQKILVTVLVVMCIVGFATAQQNCIGAQSKEINGTLFAGTWWEAARSPAPQKPLSCVELNFTHHAESQSLSVSALYSETNGTYMNVDGSWNVPLANFNSFGGYNVSGENNRSTIYKLVTFENDYAVFCGYSDVTNATTVFGVILTRQNQYAKLEEVEKTANTQILLEPWKNLTTTSCYRSGASTTSVSIIALLTAAFYGLLKFAN